MEIKWRIRWQTWECRSMQSGCRGRCRRGRWNGPGTEETRGPRARITGDGDGWRAEAEAERPHAGGGVKRLMFVTYVGIEERTALR